MAYVEWHDTVRNHYKTDALMLRLNLKRYEAVGIVGMLASWAIHYRPGGFIEKRLVPVAIEWNGDGELLTKTLIDVGWLDDRSEDKVYIHDWQSVTKGYRKARKDARRRRDASAAEARRERGKSAVTVPNGTEQNRTDQSGTEQSGEDPLPPAEASGPAVVLYGHWKAQREAAPIGRDKGVRMIQFALARGALFKTLERAFMDSNLCRGKKIWEVLDEFTPQKLGQKSVDSILSKWAGGSDVKK